MKHKSSRALYDYWNKLRGERSAPDRSAIEPAAIRDVLRDTFILRSDIDGYPFRLAGTRLCALFGRELKATRFTDLWDFADLDHVDALVEGVAEEGQPIIIGVAGMASRGRRVGLELLLLPVVQEGPGYDRILGVAAPMETPYWLGADPLTHQSILSARVLRPDTARTSGRAALLQSMLVPPNASRSAPETRRDRFVVVEGGKSG